MDTDGKTDRTDTSGQAAGLEGQQGTGNGQPATGNGSGLGAALDAVAARGRAVDAARAAEADLAAALAAARAALGALELHLRGLWCPEGHCPEVLRAAELLRPVAGATAGDAADRWRDAELDRAGRERDEAVGRLEEVLGVLSDLMDEQDGPPLALRRRQWDRAAGRAEAVLAKYGHGQQWVPDGEGDGCAS